MFDYQKWRSTRSFKSCPIIFKNQYYRPIKEMIRNLEIFKERKGIVHHILSETVVD